MKHEEWRATSEEYKELAISSAKAAVAMEEWERVAISLARHENAFFASSHGSPSASSAWQLIVGGASMEFCENLGALMAESESGWSEMSRRMAEGAISGYGRIKPENIDMLLLGMSRNGSAPVAYWKTMGTDLILAAQNKNFRMVAPWGVSTALGGAMWHEAWLEALAISEDYVRKNLIVRAGEHLAVAGREAFHAIGLAASAKKSWGEIVEEYGGGFSQALQAADRAIESGFLDEAGRIDILKEGAEIFCSSCREVEGEARAGAWPAMIAMTSEAFAGMVLAEARSYFSQEDFALLENGSLELAAGRRKPAARLGSRFRGAL